MANNEQTHFQRAATFYESRWLERNNPARVAGDCGPPFGIPSLLKS